jgi:hypothetical protein
MASSLSTSEQTTLTGLPARDLTTQVSQFLLRQSLTFQKGEEMIRPRTLFTALSLSIFLLLGASQVTAESSNGKREVRVPKSCKLFRKTVRQIDLSDSQKGETAELLDQYFTTLEADHEATHEAAKELFRIIHAPTDDGTVDEQGIRDAFTNFAAFGEEKAVLQGETASALQQVLNEEQYQTFVKARAHFIACIRVPKRVVGRHLKWWINQHTPQSE